MGKSALVFLACALFSFHAIASSVPDIQQAAIKENLWKDPYWNKLLHYEKKTFGGYESQADGRDFFLSPEGKVNPRAELLTDIELLFERNKTYDDPNDHPACMFPLRYEWIKQKLNLEVPDHQDLNCPDFQSWISRLGATGVSLVFASSFTNNPASMFGHTLLRLQRTQNGSELPPLLSYTVNFAAETGKEKGMLYTVKGLFGAYPGYFSTFPYYVKIQQYNNWESRDIWEYQLNLSSDQLHKLVLHLWEMGHTYFDYYFGDENCSYFLLALLENVDDETQLRSHLPFFTIPVDTMKIVVQHTPWVTEQVYRPSLRRKYENRYGLLNHKERIAFNSLMENQQTAALSGSSESKAKVLDAMIDFQAMKQKQNAKTDFQKELLASRSQIEVPSSEPEIQKPGNPLDSHATMRLGLGGSRLAGSNFAHLDFRGAYHDLLDNPNGFDPGAQIQSMEGRIRVSTENGDVSLDHLKLIEVVSLNPLQRYLSKQSWNVGFGWRTNYSRECFNCGAFYVEGGSGFTLGNSNRRRILFTVFANGFFQAGPWNDTDYQIGPSGTSLLLMDISDHLRLMLSGNARYSPFGEPNFIYKGNAEMAIDLSKGWSIRGWANKYSQAEEFGGSLIRYF